jgi:hypothetical protein
VQCGQLESVRGCAGLLALTLTLPCTPATRSLLRSLKKKRTVCITITIVPPLRGTTAAHRATPSIHSHTREAPRTWERLGWDGMGVGWMWDG